MSYFRNMDLGKMLLVEKGAVISALAPKSLRIGNNVKISAYSSIHVSKNYQKYSPYRANCIYIKQNILLMDIFQ